MFRPDAPVAVLRARAIADRSAANVLSQVRRKGVSYAGPALSRVSTLSARTPLAIRDVGQAAE
jgi:hypothetical protein